MDVARLICVHNNFFILSGVEGNTAALLNFFCTENKKKEHLWHIH